MNNIIFDKIENIDLIKNNCKHILFEFNENNTSYFRIAYEAHNLLIRSMVQSLRGTNNLQISGRRSKNREYTFIVGDAKPVIIKKELVESCKYAWRFSSPQVLDDYKIDNDIERQNDDNSNYLLGFYDLLAMVQSEYFMRHYCDSKIIIISDDDLKTLEWLHENIRNNYEHFIPKTFLAPISDLVISAYMCINFSWELLFESDTVPFFKVDEEIKELLINCKDALKSKIE